MPDEEADRHYRSQLSYISYQGDVLVDRFLRFENLVSDWEILRKEYDLPALPRYKKTGAADSYRGIYEKFPETKELVTERYGRDIEFFGYDF